MKDLFENVVADCETYVEVDSIEILGYAINDIAEANAKAKDLPEEYRDKLCDAYALILEVQEYLYAN
mgnify:CR=1 FL=1